MALKKHGRRYDVVLVGATGYTGRLTAEHIAVNLPTNLNWAIAGRSGPKLQQVAADCQKLNADRLPPAIELADIDDESQIRSLILKAFVVITTVGPYCIYGEPIFKLCAETGTHYLDCTGEVTWVARMIKRHHETAKRSGALMIPQDGIESAPPDLMTWAMAAHLRREFNAPVGDTIITIHKLNSAASGGTLSTLLTHFEHFSLNEILQATKPFAISPVPHNSGAKPHHTFLEGILGVTSRPNLGILTTSVAGKTDRALVGRTWGLLHEIPSRKDEFYGHNFTWAEYFNARNRLRGFVIHVCIAIGACLLTFVPPFRSLVKKYVYQPGEGTSREDMAKEEIEYRGTAYPDLGSNPRDKQAFCRAWYRGSMYALTGAFLAQSALTILEDDLQLEGGVLTPACLGQGYIDRLSAVGLKIEVSTIEN